MPTTPSTDIEVAQKAMVLIGLEPLTSFTDNTDEALVANTIFEDVVSDCLGQHTWNFATGQKELARLTDVPVDRWDAAYALPTSPPVIQVQTITIDDQPQPYDIYERYIISMLKQKMMLFLIMCLDQRLNTGLQHLLWVIFRLHLFWLCQ